MIFIMNTSINLDTLDVEELMDVKGGIADKAVKSNQGLWKGQMGLS